MKDVKIYKPQQLSSGDDQDGLSAAQNEEVETPLSAALLTAVPQKGEATRPPPNCRHEQTRDTAHSPFSTSVQGEATRPSVHEAPQQGDTTRPLPNSMPAQVESTKPSVSTGPKQREATRPRPNRTPEQTINAMFTQSSKMYKEMQPTLNQPSHSIRKEAHLDGPPHPIRKKHSASCYWPPRLNRA